MKFKVIVKTNAAENKLLGFDDSRGAYRVEIAARPEKGQANAELIKFMSKRLGRKVSISSGKRSTVKILKFDI